MATSGLPDHRTLASLSRINLLHELQQRGAMTVTELAEATGLHHNTVREHLQRLVDAGFVSCETVRRPERGRPKLLYSTTADHADRMRNKRVESALARAEQLRRLVPQAARPEVSATVARQLDVLDDHMDQCGFDSTIRTAPAPEPAEPSDGASADPGAFLAEVHMHGCPFDKLVRDHPHVCDVHFGLVRDTLRQAGGPLEARELNPVESRDCTMRLGADAAAARGSAPAAAQGSAPSAAQGCEPGAAPAAAQGSAPAAAQGSAPAAAPAAATGA